LAVEDPNDDALDEVPLITVYERKKKGLADSSTLMILLSLLAQLSKYNEELYERYPYLVLLLYARVLVHQLFHLQMKVLNAEVLESAQLRKPNHLHPKLHMCKRRLPL
jgi:hypothetical protein